MSQLNLPQIRAIAAAVVVAVVAVAVVVVALRGGLVLGVDHFGVEAHQF